MRRIYVAVAVVVLALVASAAPAGASPKGTAAMDSVSYSAGGGAKVVVFYDTSPEAGQLHYAATVTKQKSRTTVHAGSVDTLNDELVSLYGPGAALTDEARAFLASQ